MSNYKKINSSDYKRTTFQVHKTWKLNQSSDELFRQTYVSASSGKSGSYWHSLSMNFYKSASAYEGYPSRSMREAISGKPGAVDFTIPMSHWKWTNRYYSLGHTSQIETNDAHLNKFGKNWNTGSVISISQLAFGENIKPGSLKLIDKSTSETIELRDDNKGNVYAINPPTSQSNNSPSSSVNHVGNIFYNMGIIVLKETSSYSSSVANSYTNVGSNEFTLNFKSTKTITTTEYQLKVEPNEFLYTTNPTANVPESSSLPSNIKSKLWTPYFTTVGLYDEHKKLIMVGKVSQPIKRSKILPLTITMKYDY